MKTFKILLFLFLMANPGPGHALPETGEVSQFLRGWLEAATKSQQVWVGCEPIHAGKDLVDFYHRRDDRPVWVSEEGPCEAARELLAVLGNAERHGLFPRDYHFTCLSEWLKPASAERPWSIDAKELAGMEIVLSDAFVTFGNHLASGKIDPETIYPHWISPRKKNEVFGLLAGITTAQDVDNAVEALAPVGDGYRAAMDEARRLRTAIASGQWREIEPGETLRIGDQSARIEQVRARLIVEGDLAGPEESGEGAAVFDDRLQEAVIRFQRRHGLSPDGAIGRQTLAALNRSPQDRLRCVLVNMERWRWLPRDLGRRHIIVNPPAFQLEAFQEGRKVMEMPVIVGEAYTKTPVFSKNMTYLVINPYWNVPRGVLARKILPKIKKDPGYIASHHFELIGGWKESAAPLDPTLIDWSTIHAGNFPGRLRQRPGPWNSLGRIKFIFPNDFSVYLHDTPDRHLFQRTARAYSSGCIRVEKPIDLALFVLAPDPSWDRDRIEGIIAEAKTTTVVIKDPLTVHLQYWTFWVKHTRWVLPRPGRPKASTLSALSTKPPSQSVGSSLRT
ncbi:murein L,D-transpeptidase, partial [Desulfosarcina sp.]|uniref:L,D-transpeptidase family protein n=1 Tax=Desulfosarcina sp. TaxID=2027861 RepID=UPI003971102D